LGVGPATADECNVSTLDCASAEPWLRFEWMFP